jgi:hypothetical protein
MKRNFSIHSETRKDYLSHKKRRMIKESKGSLAVSHLWGPPPHTHIWVFASASPLPLPQPRKDIGEGLQNPVKDWRMQKHGSRVVEGVLHSKPKCAPIPNQQPPKSHSTMIQWVCGSEGTLWKEWERNSRSEDAQTILAVAKLRWYTPIALWMPRGSKSTLWLSINTQKRKDSKLMDINCHPFFPRHKP